MTTIEFDDLNENINKLIKAKRGPFKLSINGIKKTGRITKDLYLFTDNKRRFILLNTKTKNSKIIGRNIAAEEIRKAFKIFGIELQNSKLFLKHVKKIKTVFEINKPEFFQDDSAIFYNNFTVKNMVFNDVQIKTVKIK